MAAQRMALNRRWMRIEDVLRHAAFLPIIEIDSIADAAPLARALHAGGLRAFEVTKRSAAACAAVAAMKDATPDAAIGMGTIRNRSDIAEALAAGAEFLVSPGASEGLLGDLAASGAPALPGVATAGEAMTAFESGFGVLKFFPAESAGGPTYLRALFGPLPDIRFCPTGGIGEDRAVDYLALPNVLCVGGSWVAPRAMIAAGDFAGIETLARRAASLAKHKQPSGTANPSYSARRRF